MYFEGLSGSSTTELSESFELLGVRVVRDERNVYRAYMEITTPKIFIAKESTIERVREALALVATSNDGFRISFGSGITSKILKEDS